MQPRYRGDGGTLACIPSIYVHFRAFADGARVVGGRAEQLWVETAFAVGLYQCFEKELVEQRRPNGLPVRWVRDYKVWISHCWRRRKQLCLQGGQHCSQSSHLQGFPDQCRGRFWAGKRAAGDAAHNYPASRNSAAAGAAAANAEAEASVDKRVRVCVPRHCFVCIKNVVCVALFLKRGGEGVGRG